MSYPAASPYVVAVGGTTLTQTTNAGTRSATETAWAGAGSGCSRYEAKPTWQKDTGCAKRADADVSAVANPSTGVWTYSAGQWKVVGGTSAASPIVAAMGMLSPTIFSASDLYTNASLIDITGGSNGTCGRYLCTSVAGYDGPTGLGVFNGPSTFAPDFSISANPATQTLSAGAGASIAVNLSAVRSFSDAVTLSLQGAPADSSLSTTTPAWSGSTAGATLSIPRNTPAGTYAITITATNGGSRTHTATVNIVVRDYSMQAAASTLTIVQGKSATVKETLATDSGYTSKVNMSALGAPSGMTVKFSAATVAPTKTGATETVTFVTTGVVPTGTYPVTVTATSTDSGAATHSTVVYVKVVGFTVGVDQATLAAAAGQSATNNVNLVASDSSVAPTLRLVFTGLPKGVTAKVSTTPAAIPSVGGTQVGVTFAVATSAPAASGTITITASASGFPNQTTTVAFTVTGVNVSGSTTSIARGASGSTNVSLTPVGSFAPSVTLTYGTMPKGVTLSSPVTTASIGTTPRNVTVAFNVASNATPGTYKIPVKIAADGYVTQTATVTLVVS